jgi:hypothetical protein
MFERATQLDALTRHFFRLFFKTEPASTETPVVRALAIVATPMLMAAFWIVTLAHGMHGWDAAATHYLFVLYSFCAMGCVTAAQWETLFPDRMDFLILLPMPLRRGTMFAAKLRAVLAVLGLFLASANVGGTLLMPALAGRHILIAFAAQALAVLFAGAAAALGVLFVEAVVIAVTPERWFGRVAPVVQALMIGAFLLMFLRMAVVMERAKPWLSGSMPAARWYPPVWFLALYECVWGGVTATPFAHALCRYALFSVPVLAALVTLAYPAAWAVRRRAALEGVRSAQLRDPPWSALLHATVLRDADARAIFHFIRQTLMRQSRYHVYLAVYCGVGLALCVTTALHMDESHLRISDGGIKAAMPLILFWVVAGLRGAFQLPADLGARWVFRMAPLRTRRVVSVAKTLVFGVACGVVTAVIAVLAACGLSAWALVLQAVFGLICAVLLVDLFFYMEDSVPFTRPQSTGRSSLPMTLAVYVFGVPVLLLLVVTAEHYAAGHPWRITEFIVGTAAVHVLMHWLRRLPSHPASDDAFLSENDSDVQTLGLNV